MDAYDELLLRHYALEMIVQHMLNTLYPGTLDTSAESIRNAAAAIRAGTRPGSFPAAARGLDAPVLDIVAELLESAASLARPELGPVAEASAEIISFPRSAARLPIAPN